MWPWRSDTPLLALTGGGIAWRWLDGRWVRCAGLEQAEPKGPRPWLPRRAQVWLAGPDVVHWRQPVVEGARSVTELHVAAQQRCSALFGGGPASWWLAADWSAQAPSICGAVPVTLPAQLQAQHPERKLRCSTWWMVLAGLCKPSGAEASWTAVDLGPLILAMRWEGGRLSCLDGIRIGDPAMPLLEKQQEVEARLQLIALRDGRPQGAEPARWLQAGEPLPAPSVPSARAAAWAWQAVALKADQRRAAAMALAGCEGAL